MDGEPRRGDAVREEDGLWFGCVLLGIAFALGSGVSLVLWVLFIRWAATCA